MAEGGRRSLGGLAAIAVLVFVLILSASYGAPAKRAGLPTTEPVRVSAPPSGQWFDYVVIILMENHNFCDVYTHCGGTGPYETQLGDNFSVPHNDNYCHINPSLPNYLCLTGGSTFGCTADDNPNSGCATAAWNAPNIVDRLVTGGVSWKAYMEDMTSNCQNTGSGNYAVRHDPFVYYNDIWSNPSRCSRVVPAGPSAGSDTTFLSDLNSVSTASNYMWLTPNTLNDAHDTSVAYGDAYLKGLVPQILNSPVFTTTRAALFITYDEGYSNPTFAEWAGPVVKTGYNSTTLYDHFSVLKTVEDNWGLSNLTSNDGTAANMAEFFKPAPADFSLTANPASVYFKPGGSNTSSISVHASGGFAGGVALTNSTPSGLTTACAPSNITPSQVSVCTFNSTSANAYTVIITGTYGALVHSVTIRITVSTLPPPKTTITLSGTSGSSGWYVSAVSVTLKATNLGTNGSIWYHVDASPWQVYVSVFVVGDGSHTVYYNATNDAGIQEPTNSSAVNVDTSPPTVTRSLVGVVGANGWYTSGVRITLTAVDNASGVASISYTIDSGSVQAYSNPFDVTDGIHAVTYSATDVAGLRSANGNVSLKVVTTPPAFHALSPSGVVTQSTVTISWNATDTAGITGYQVRIDNGSYRNLGLSTSLQVNLTDGPHTIQVIAVDNAGLQNAAVIHFEVNTGAVSPSIWQLLVPLVAIASVLVAFAIALVVIRMRRRRKAGARRQR